CCERQRSAWRGRSNRAASAPRAACRNTKAANSSSSTRFRDRSTRCGGQNKVTVPWLLPANSAIATATPNRARSQRAARIRDRPPARRALAGSPGGGEQRERGGLSFLPARRRGGEHRQ